jgi:hypothetical protein
MCPAIDFVVASFMRFFRACCTNVESAALSKTWVQELIDITGFPLSRE